MSESSTLNLQKVLLRQGGGVSDIQAEQKDRKKEVNMHTVHKMTMSNRSLMSEQN